MRLGGPVFGKPADPAAWVEAHRRSRYTAAYAPAVKEEAQLAEYVAAAKNANLIIAEVGAWSNPISPNPDERAKALDKCRQSLEQAEKIGARCCVNIAGSRNKKKWDGPDPENFSDETFQMIVDCTRQIIDAVKPKRTFFALETMPWIFPDSADSYLDLIRAIDRKQFAVHLDPVNIINCPRRAFRSGDCIRECFAKLGPHIRSCHAKDIKLDEKLTTHLDECRPGTGVLDYKVFLKELSRLDPDTPLMLEHLKAAEEYDAAAAYVRSIAAETGVNFV